MTCRDKSNENCQKTGPPEELLAEYLKVVGLGALEDAIDVTSRNIQKPR
jgi:hypothetical protein